jgi:hypothetical protein
MKTTKFEIAPSVREAPTVLPARSAGMADDRTSIRAHASSVAPAAAPRTYATTLQSVRQVRGETFRGDVVARACEGAEAVASVASAHDAASVVCV